MNADFLARELSEKNLIKHLKINSTNSNLPRPLQQALVALARTKKKDSRITCVELTGPLSTSEFEISSKVLHLPDGRLMKFKLVVKAWQRPYEPNSSIIRYKLAFSWI